MVPGESKEGGAPQWPPQGVPDTPRRRKILGKGARRHGRFPKPSMLNIQTGMKGGAPPWPLSQKKGAPHWPLSRTKNK